MSGPRIPRLTRCAPLIDLPRWLRRLLAASRISGLELRAAQLRRAIDEGELAALSRHRDLTDYREMLDAVRLELAAERTALEALQ